MTESDSNYLSDDTIVSLDFDSNVMASIQASISQRKPLMLFVSENNDVSNDWINKLIFNNDSLTLNTKKCLSSEFIRLQIIKNSIDFNNLVSIMPFFSNIITPCICFIFSGQVVDFVPKDFDAKLINDKIKSINENLTTLKQPSSGAVSQTSVSSAPATHSTTPTSPESQIPINNSTSVNRNAPAKSFKEESAEIASKKYRENLLKQQKQAKLDKERILRLLELDRQENKNKNRPTRLQNILDSELINNQNIHENMRNSRLQNSETYVIQLKFFDGATTRHQFKSSDKLSDVRDFILQTYPDYNSLPFYFFKNIDRITFGDADENKSLLSLNLNMSTLILKPVEPNETPTIPDVNEFQNSSSFNWLKHKMYSYLWPNFTSSTSTLNATTDRNNEISNNSSSSLVDTNNRINNSNVFTSSISQHAQYEDENDNGSVYHTPILASVPSSSSIRPILSNFNIYGSQGLISSVSRDTSHLDLEQLQNDFLQHHDSSSSSNSSTTRKNKKKNNGMKIEQTNYTVTNTEEMDIHNGNSISLQFPDDD
jgi:hypothetical protein